MGLGASLTYVFAGKKYCSEFSHWYGGSPVDATLTLRFPPIPVSEGWYNVSYFMGFS
jgi:hypothetical protein